MAQALRDFDQAWRNFRAGTHRGPRWRNAGSNEGLCVRDVSVGVLNRRWAEITVPKTGRVRFRVSRPLPEAFGMARVTLDPAGRWHWSFTATQGCVARRGGREAVGIDRGVATTVVTSDGMYRVPSMPGWVAGNAAAAKAGLNRAIHRSVWSLLHRRLADKAAASGVSRSPIGNQAGGRSKHPRRGKQACLVLG